MVYEGTVFVLFYTTEHLEEPAGRIGLAASDWPGQASLITAVSADAL